MGLKPRPRSQRDPLREPAFEQFVADSSTWLLRSAYLLTGDRSAAEDLLQLDVAAHGETVALGTAGAGAVCEAGLGEPRP